MSTPELTTEIMTLHAEIARLRRCIYMAMGCIDPLSNNPDERLGWLRLEDAVCGREPRASLPNP